MRAHAAALLLLCTHALATGGPFHVGQYGHVLEALHQPDIRPSWRRLSDRVSPPGKLLTHYEDHMVLRFTLRTQQEAQRLAEAVNTLFLDVWEFNDQWVDLRIAKDVVPSLLGLLPDSLQRAHVALMHDHHLAEAIFNSYPTIDPAATPSREQSAQTDLFFRDYQPLSVIMPWMRLMASLFTTHTALVNIGLSYEGRDIPALKVGVRPADSGPGSGPRKTILVTGGSHAREWISVSTVSYLAYSFMTSYGKSAATTSLLEAFDWVFVPTLNPDGYVYTWETDRLWRKNRQMTSLPFCRGVDLDHSYDFHWDGESTRNNPCSESYAGEAAFDGVEAKRFADWARNETEHSNVEFVAFIDLHSYSQQVLYPYSYSCAEVPPSLEDLEEVALGLAKAIRLSKNGHSYKVTSACEGNVVENVGRKGQKALFPRIESGGGSAIDYFYDQLGVRYSYQIKLRDTGSYGFLLPKENIIPTGKEVLHAMFYLGHFLLGDIGFAEQEVRPVDEEEMAMVLPDNNEHAITGWELKRRRRR